MAREDLTGFIKNSEVLLISDFEGTAPTAHFENFIQFCKEKKTIFLGDLFDSTVTMGDKNCNADDCKNPDLPHDKGCIKNENYCALRTIKTMVDYQDNCRYCVGNRDINKSKIFPFFQFKEAKNTWWKTNPDNDDEWSNYEDIVVYLLFETKNKGKDDLNLWLISSNEEINLFKPFWNKDWNANVKKRENKNYNDIFERFEYIFGKDGQIGTMSAIITLKSIPNELLQLDDSTTDTNSFEPFLQKIKTRIPLNGTDIEVSKKVRAALTITLFMRMLDKDLFTGAKPNMSIKDFGALDGYLYTYLTNASPAYYATTTVSNTKDNTLLTFAHGGITNEFVEKEEASQGGIDSLYKVKNWSDILKKGGTKPKFEITSKKIMDSINKFNKTYIGLVTQFLAANYHYTPPVDENEPGTWKHTMLILLQLTAGQSISIDQSLKDQGYDAALSPIQIKKSSGKGATPAQLNDEPSKKIIDPTDYKRYYNIFGHASLSSGYSLGKVADSTNTFFINTDFSTTLFKESLSCDKYNDSYLLLLLNTHEIDGESISTLHVRGTIILDKTKYFPAPLKTASVNNNLVLVTLNSEIKNEIEKNKEYNEKVKKLEEQTLLENPKAKVTGLNQEPKNFYYIHDNINSSSLEIKKEVQPIDSDFTFTMHDKKDLFDEASKRYCCEETPLKESLKGEKNPIKDYRFNGYTLINGKEYAVYSSPWGKNYAIAFVPFPKYEFEEGHYGGGGRKWRTKKRKQIKKKRTKKIKKVKRRKSSSKKRT
jgi:hypothetical protein